MAIDQHEDDPRAAESARPSSAPPRRAIEVVYRGGRLTPAEPLDLPDGTPVLLRVPGHAVSGRMSNGAWRSEPAPQPELGAVEGICEGGAIALASPLGLPEGTPLRLEIDERVAVMAALPIDRADIAQPRPDNGGAGAGPKQPADAAWAGLLGSRSGWRAFAAVMLALVLVYGGQLALSATSGADPREGSVQALAGGMLIAGALLFGAATRRWRDPPARLELPRDSDPPALARAERESPGWLAAAIALSAGAIGAFAVFGESPAVVLAWLASMAALLFSQLWNAPLARARVAREPRPYLAALALLLAIALITRAYNLTTLPYNVDGDFASVGLLTRALATGQQRQIFAYDGWAFQPWLGYLAPWLTMLLFGTGLAGLNASGVAAGLLIILGVYLLGRDLFQPRVGLLAAALLTISYAHLAASRQSSYIDPVLYLSRYQ